MSSKNEEITIDIEDNYKKKKNECCCSFITKAKILILIGSLIIVSTCVLEYVKQKELDNLNKAQEGIGYLLTFQNNRLKYQEESVNRG